MNTNLKNLKQSSENKTLYEGLIDGTILGEDTLERFPRPQTENAPTSLELNIEIPEFTSLCPVTGQPDFATIKIRYIADDWCVESKSLKLYILSFRNRRDFHEACITKIADDLIKLLNPISLNVVGEFTPRGGIPFWPTVSYERDI